MYVLVIANAMMSCLVCKMLLKFDPALRQVRFFFPIFFMEKKSIYYGGIFRIKIFQILFLKILCRAHDI